MNSTDIKEKKRMRNNIIIGISMFAAVLLITIATFIYQM